MSKLTWLQKACIQAANVIDPDEVARFKRFDFFLNHYVLSNPYVEKKLAKAIAHKYYLFKVLNYQNHNPEFDALAFAELGDLSTRNVTLMYNKVSTELENISKSIRDNDWDLSSLKRISIETFKNESRPILLSLMTEIAWNAANRTSGETLAGKLPKTDKLSGQERLVLKVLVTGSRQSNGGKVSVSPLCQSDDCDRKGMGDHTATWVIYCPKCGDVEMFCKRMRDYLLYSSQALPVHFSRGCGHAFLDSRDCFVEELHKTFNYSTWESYLKMPRYF